MVQGQGVRPGVPRVPQPGTVVARSPEVIDAARAEVEADPEPALYLRPEEHPWPS